MSIESLLKDSTLAAPLLPEPPLYPAPASALQDVLQQAQLDHHVLPQVREAAAIVAARVVLVGDVVGGARAAACTAGCATVLEQATAVPTGLVESQT